MRALRSFRSAIAGLLLLLYMPACTSSHVVATPSPAQLVETRQPLSIRGTLTSGANFALGSPVVRGDSLVGSVGPRDASSTISLALSDLTSVSIGQDAGTSWEVGTPTPARFVETEHPQSIRVTRTNGRALTLKSPMVRGDSLVGSVSSDGAAPSTGVSLRDVGSVAVSKTSGGKTALLLVGIVAVPIIAFVAALAAACGGSRGCQ